MKLSRIGLLLALPACAASGLSPSVAWAGKFARAAERIQAVVPASLMPASSLVGDAASTTSADQSSSQPVAQAPAAAATSTAVSSGPSFSITVAPDPTTDPTVHDQGAASQTPSDAPRATPAERPSPAGALTGQPALGEPTLARPSPVPPANPATPAFAPTATARRNTPTLAPPRLPASTPAGVAGTSPEPSLLPASTSGPTPAELEALANKPATAGPGQPVSAPTGAPQRLTAETNSDGLRPVLVAPTGPTLAPEHGFGHNALRSTPTAAGTPVYRNVLREGPADTQAVADANPSGTDGGVEQTAGRLRGNGLKTAVPATGAGQAVGPSTQATTPKTIVGKTTSPAAAPSATPSATPSTTAPPATASAGTGSNRPATGTPAPSQAASRPVAAPPRTTTSTVPPRGTAYVGDDREPGSLDKKSVVGNQPADRQSQQLFESEAQPPAMTAELELLRKRVQMALAYYYQNWTLNTREHSPWEVMHAIIAYGVDTRLAKGHAGGERTTAIGHLCYSGICNNQPILTIRNDKLYALRGPGVQGHSGQFLAILAQSYLQRDYPLYVGGEKYTLEDLIRAEQEDCESGTELTFKLIGLMHYLPSDATWTNFQGQTWSLDRLVREEIVQPVRGAACGGTHRLMGLSYAIRKREQRDEPISGIYLEARKYIDQYHKYTFSLQNRDGSFSTAWFVRPEARNDLDRRMQTTGHILEWLCFSLSDEQLRDPRVIRAVRYVTDQLLNQGVNQWEIGHLGHALHALQIYNERVFGGPIRSFEGLVSKRPARTAARPPTAAPTTAR